AGNSRLASVSNLSRTKRPRGFVNPESAPGGIQEYSDRIPGHEITPSRDIVAPHTGFGGRAMNRRRWLLIPSIFFFFAEGAQAQIGGSIDGVEAFDLLLGR
ncbi:MAG: hypothetical protein ACRD21_23195, partial [Vicinamibacteria bacterium]